jgi:hypothetical protein
MAIGSTRKRFSVPVKVETSMAVCPTFLKDSEHLEELKRIPTIQSMYSKKIEPKGDLRDIKPWLFRKLMQETYRLRELLRTP